MKLLCNIAIATEILSAVLFLVHINYKPLGSDLMFGVLIAALITCIFLLWQSFKNPAIAGMQKIMGIACAALPLIWILLFIKQFI
jgi:hypothetical protein